VYGSQTESASAATIKAIKVVVDPTYGGSWSAQADWYTADGTLIHHWDESHKRGDHVLWLYNNPSLGQVMHIWVRTPGITSSYLGQDPTQSHCYVVDRFGGHPYTC
jgi:hypothetical protein